MNTSPRRINIGAIHRAIDELAGQIKIYQVSAEVARKEEDLENLQWFENEIFTLSDRLCTIKCLAGPPRNERQLGGTQ